MASKFLIALIVLVSCSTSFGHFLLLADQDGVISDSSASHLAAELLPEAGLTCNLCKDSLAMIQGLAKRSENLTKAVLATFCKTLKVEAPDVCQGLIDRYGTVVLGVLNTHYLDPNQFCTAVKICTSDSPYLDPCNKTQVLASDAVATIGSNILAGNRARGRKSVPAFTIQSHSRKEDLKHTPEVRRKRRTSQLRAQYRTIKDAQAGHFLHVTDIHFDPLYLEGAETQCGKPLCCRAEDGPGATPIRSAQRVGNEKGDTSGFLLDSLLNFSSTSPAIPALDFIVYTGDTPPHTIWEDTQKTTGDILRTVYSKLKAAYKDLPIYPVLGNHGAVPADELATSDTSFPTDLLWELWRQWLPEDCEQSVKKGLFYTVLHSRSLRIVALNTQWCDTMNFYLLSSMEADPAGQLAWLEQTLQSAKENHERVLILGHIPLGDISCYISYTDRYVALLSKYQDLIVGQLFGHKHTDQFKVYHDSKDVPVGVALMAPSVTPFGGGNPSFRLFSYLQAQANAATPAKLIDYWQYILDLDAANAIGRADNWTVSYQATKEYSLPDLSPASFAALAFDLGLDAAMLQKYIQHQHADRNFTCDDSCRTLSICYATSTSVREYRQCAMGKGGASLRLALLLNSLMKC